MQENPRLNCCRKIGIAGGVAGIVEVVIGALGPQIAPQKNIGALSGGLIFLGVATSIAAVVILHLTGRARRQPPPPMPAPHFFVGMRPHRGLQARAEINEPISPIRPR